MTQLSSNEEFDYIVIGAGIGGLVVASRLGEDGTKSILLIEAGPDLKEDPALRHRITQPRGRVVGGSSSLNFSMIMYPSCHDFEAWGELGNKGWNTENMAPYLRKFHKYTAPDHAVAEQLGLHSYLDPSQQGRSGPVPVCFPATYGTFNRAWDETFAKLGWQDTRDPIGGAKLGAFTCPLSVHPENSTRGLATVYPIDRPNISLLTETVVERILFTAGDGSNGRPTATGVQINGERGQRKVILARKEVILSAGSLHSPQLLEISGIGGAKLLKKHGIPVVVNLPGVGENLQDHCISSISYKVAEGQVSGDIMRDPQVAQSVMELYQKTKTGPLAGLPISVAFLPLVDGSKRASTEDRRHIIDTHLTSAPMENSGTSLRNKTQTEIISRMLRDSTEAVAEYIFLPFQLHTNSGTTSMADLFEKKADGNYISILVSLCHPFSRGSVHIKSSNVDDKPVFDPNYLSHPLDLEILARHTQYIEQIVQSEPFRSLLQPEDRIPAVSITPDLKDPDVARRIVRDRLFSCFHPAGSCSMMPVELGGVVDDQLRVHGTSKLRVVDASIFPLEPRGNIQATVYAVAERAADLIRGNSIAD